MKFLKLWAAAAILCGISAVSFCIGRDYESQYGQAFEDACRMSDLIRCYNDHLSEDSLIQDWGCFEELESIYLYDDALGSTVDLNDYIYSY